MHVPFSLVRCPSCGSTFEAANSIPPSDNFVLTTCSQADHRGRDGEKFAPASVLHSWKDISAYVGRGIRTVQRWEHDLGLPVHRAGDHERSAVIAFPEEIEQWLHSTPIGVRPKSAVPGSEEGAGISHGRALHEDCA